MSLPYTKIADANDMNDLYFMEDCRRLLLPIHNNRKTWEMGMALRGLDAELICDLDEANILGVGAGVETTIACLSQLARSVIATDLYDDPKEWANQTGGEVTLQNPETLFKSPTLNLSKVKFQVADATKLPFDDHTFDGIFSSSSIEHFGNFANIARAANEMHRVLVPDGIAAISTEFLLSGPSYKLNNIQFFDQGLIEEIFPFHKWMILNADWTHPEIKDVMDLERYMRDKEYRDAHANHFILGVGSHVWTSIHLTMRKV